MVIPCKDEQQCPAPRQLCTWERSGPNRAAAITNAKKLKVHQISPKATSGQLRNLGFIIHLFA
ncbi:MAG: hypothetical protein BWY57_01962 [Betaproteobacteria bacterium ADurb.Bin341]|nr:MAG: hypothetical protein BWY57_01962 [Betaproteobacteria bacterium ADurb.Bin341]